jgi:hypothetical protein
MSMSRGKRTLIAVPLLLLGLLGPPASAATLRQVIPVTLSFTACSGEQVALSGEILILANYFKDANGSFHLMESTAWRNLTGVGASGASYHMVGGMHGTVEGGGAVTALTHVFSGQLLIISDMGENLLVRVVYHVTLTPNSEFTGRVDRSSSICLGG